MDRNRASTRDKRDRKVFLREAREYGLEHEAEYEEGQPKGQAGHEEGRKVETGRGARAGYDSQSRAQHECVCRACRTGKGIEYDLDSARGKIAGQVKGSFIQEPLKPAWTITIHKSQGQTFDRVHIDLGRGAFAHGQTCVAPGRTHQGRSWSTTASAPSWPIWRHETSEAPETEAHGSMPLGWGALRTKRKLQVGDCS